MAYNFSDFKNSIKKVEDWLGKEYTQINTGRATPALLDGVMVESYGSLMPIKNVSNISIEDPRTLRVLPWDKAQIKEVERALYASNMGFSISVDDQGIRVSFPQLTTERRIQLVKLLKDRLEDARISLRKEREDVWQDIQEQEKNGDLSEDDKFRAKEELQKYVDEGNKSLEMIFERKERDVMQD